ncbi:hypothetical protein [Azotosporobacter soli]|uniref:hypothetical protein n=1 Tax=Azotosporobacter soli TaxID=3055040 RepID=UPI0031FE9069
MGLFDFLFGKPKAKQSKKKKRPPVEQSVENRSVPEGSDAISPEVMAILSAAAAAYVILEEDSKDIVFRIKRVNTAWEMAGRQQQMNARSK